MSFENMRNIRLDAIKTSKERQPYHVMTINIYRPITPDMALYLTNSWCEFFTKGICFGVSEYSINFEECPEKGTVKV